MTSAPSRYHPGAPRGDGGWSNRGQTAEILGISNIALILLQRDKVLPPDCAACGRIRWRTEELHTRRAELREYLNGKYGYRRGELVITAQ